jgi:hypothetical protein
LRPAVLSLDYSACAAVGLRNTGEVTASVQMCSYCNSLQYILLLVVLVSYRDLGNVVRRWAGGLMSTIWCRRERLSSGLPFRGCRSSTGSWSATSRSRGRFERSVVGLGERSSGSGQTFASGRWRRGGWLLTGRRPLDLRGVPLGSSRRSAAAAAAYRGAAVAGMLLVAACGGDGETASPETSTTTTSTTMSTTSSTIDPATAEAQEVIEAYEAAERAGIEAGSIPDPDHPSLEATHTGPMLERSREVLDSFEVRAIRYEYPEDSEFRVLADPAGVEIDGDVAIFEACVVDDGHRVHLDTGERVGESSDDVGTALVRVAMQRDNDVWKLAERQGIEEWDGVAGCAA